MCKFVITFAVKCWTMQSCQCC